jgi:hypothetical protein
MGRSLNSRRKKTGWVTSGGLASSPTPQILDQRAERRRGEIDAAASTITVRGHRYSEGSETMFDR